MSSRLAGFCVAAVLLSITVTDVQALGAKGYRTTGLMAHDLLTLETRVAFRQLMSSDAGHL
jgi:hypothetical protein